MSQPETKTIALTGATGFIGSKLMAALQRLGHDVVVIPRRALRSQRLVHLALANQRPDAIIHCSAYGNHYHHTFGHRVVDINYNATFFLLNEAVLFNSRFIFFSTSSVLLPHITLYSATKLGAETLVRAFTQKFGLSATILRPSSVTGPGEQPFHLIPALLRSCISGKQMKFNPYPTHDFIDVRDVIQVVLLCVSGSLKGEVYNVSSGKTTSNDLVRILAEQATGHAANTKLAAEAMRPYDNLNWKVDNSDLLSAGWQPAYTLRQSIEDMLAEIDKPANAVYTEI